MKSLEYKNVAYEVKDVDTAGRRVKAVFSKLGNRDLDNDVVAHGAFDKTIRERGPKGINLIWHLTDHNTSLKSAVAKFSELYIDGDILIGITDIPKTTWGNDVLEFYKTGNINQHSIGFRSIKAEPAEAGTPNEHRLIKEVLLYEGSTVLWGANPETPALEAGKSLTFEKAQPLLTKALDEINNLGRLFKTGHLSDETFELLDIHLIQKTNNVQQLFSKMFTQPVVETVEPNDEKVLEVFKTFSENLKTSHDDIRATTGVIENFIRKHTGAKV